MSRSFTLLVLSVALNALLLSALVKDWMRPSPWPGPHAQSGEPGTLQKTPGKSEPPSHVVSNDAHFPKVSRAKWASLYSDDTREYADRLRVAGCPEKTVRAMVRAQLYIHRERQLAGIAPAPLFASPTEKIAARMRMYKEKRAIVFQFDALAFEIAGIRILDEPPRKIEDCIIGEAIMQFISSGRPREGWDDVFSLMERGEHFSDQKRELPPIARLRENLVEAEWFRNAVAQVIPAAQQREFAERLLGMFAFDAAESDFKFTATEVRSLVRHLLNDVPDLQVPGLMIMLADGPNDLWRAHETAFDQAIEKSLAPDRFLEWRVDQDDDCQRIAAALKEETAAQKSREFYLVKEEAERAWMEVLAQPSGDEERMEKLTQLTRTYAQRVRTILPAQAWKSLNPTPCWMDVPGEDQ